MHKSTFNKKIKYIYMYSIYTRIYLLNESNFFVNTNKIILEKNTALTIDSINT